MEENKISDNTKEKAGCLIYGLGFLSFVPLVGVLIGIVTILLGIFKFKKDRWKLIILGTAGILFTIVIYSALFYFGFIQRGGVYDDLRNQMIKPQLHNAIKTIEYYKLQNGEYPSTLQDVLEEGDGQDLQYFIDPTAMVKMKVGETPLFYYELLPEKDKYYLFSSGYDGVPFSEDDILPDITQEELEKTGYTIRP